MNISKSDEIEDDDNQPCSISIEVPLINKISDKTVTITSNKTISKENDETVNGQVQVCAKWHCHVRGFNSVIPYFSDSFKG